MSGFFGFDPMDASSNTNTVKIINEEDYDLVNNETFGNIDTQGLNNNYDYGFNTQETIPQTNNLNYNDYASSINKPKELSITPEFNQVEQYYHIQQEQPSSYIPNHIEPNMGLQQSSNYFNQPQMMQNNPPGIQTNMSYVNAPNSMNDSVPNMNGNFSMPFMPNNFMNMNQNKQMPGMMMPPNMNGMPPMTPQMQQQFQQFQQMMQQGAIPPNMFMPPNMGGMQYPQQPPNHMEVPRMNEQVINEQIDINKQEEIERKPVKNGLPTLDEISKSGLTKKQMNQKLQQHQQLVDEQNKMNVDYQKMVSIVNNPNNKNYYNNKKGNLNSNANLTPEENKIRQRKVERILCHHGLMTYRDKDFLTRLQLSRIVDQDPLESDFYYQFFKIMKSTSVAGANHGLDTGMNEKDAIAKAYLDISGHRLGGKKRNVSLALQKMQSQVIAAVSVAKERSGSTVINPRKRILLDEEQKKIDDDLNDVMTKMVLENENDVQENVIYTASEALKRSKLLAESVYDIVLELENNLRNNVDLDKKEFLKLLLHNSDQDLILFLSLNKSVKLLPRMFNFLEFEEKLEFVNRLFKLLTSLDVIKESSYLNADMNPREKKFTKQNCQDFQKIFLKLACSMLSQCTLQQIIQLTQSICMNNLIMLCTTKIGLNLITVLINRTVLFKNELSMSGWESVYEYLFNSLKTHLTQCFPPNTNSKEDTYIWQFFASLAMAGRLDHQRIIIDEIRDFIFHAIDVAERDVTTTDDLKIKIYQNLNLFFNVMGLVCRNGEITEL